MLSVVGAGLGRTGTSSLRLALEELLGGPCYHMSEVSKRSADPSVWADAFEGRAPDWARFLDGYRAAVGWPSAPFWSDLAEAFPDALIVLSVRDPESWWRSVSQTIFPAMASTYFAPDSTQDDWARMAHGMMAEFSPGWQDRDTAIAAYLAHNDRVRATAPASRLVEWQATDGWTPLCRALGLAEPDTPFPHVNSTAEVRAGLGLDPG